MVSSSAFLKELFELLDQYDAHDDLWWRTGKVYGGGQYDEPATFMIKCSDAFWWGTADLEDVNEGNVHLLRQAFEDCKKADPRLGTCYGSTLFVARIRKMRPQGAAYPKDSPGICQLLNECGPEREVGPGNPKDVPCLF